MKDSKWTPVFLMLMTFLCALVITNTQNASASASPSEALSLATEDSLILQLYVDKASYNTGDGIEFSARLSMNGYGIANAQICTSLKNDLGEEIWGSCALTDDEGWIYATLSSGYAIPQDYIGYLLISVIGSYDGQDVYQELPLTYGLGDGFDDGGDDGAGLLTIYLSPYDRYEFVQGDNINYWIEVAYDSQPLVDVDICPVVTDAVGNTLSQACARTDANGTASFWLNYNQEIPTNYTGDIQVWSDFSYDDVYVEGNLTLSYLPPQENLPLELEVWGPLVPIQIGGWEEIQIGGTVTSQGILVDEAVIDISVAGGNYQTSTGWVESGNFYYGWPNDTFPAGEYPVQITASKAGFQSASGTVVFTVFGDEYDFSAVMDAIPSVLDPGINISFPGTLTLGGNPVSDWVQIEITHPNGQVEIFSNLSDSAGRFTHVQPSLVESGTYQLVVYYQSDYKQISPVYTFAVGTGGENPPTVTPVVSPPSQTSADCEIVDIQYPSPIEAGQSVDISGRVICYQGQQEIIPQEQWHVSLSVSGTDISPVFAQQTQTDSDGVFTVSMNLEDFRYNEIFIVATDKEENWGRKEYWIGPLKVMIEYTPEISFSQNDYDTGEILMGTLDLNPRFYMNGWDDGLEIIYQIVGPLGGSEQLYLFDSTGNYYDGVDHFYWQVPSNAESGNYQITAFISGQHIPTKNVDYQFFVNDIRHTQLTAFVESGEDEWSSGYLMGEFTDADGSLIPDADVRVVLQERENPHREFTLTGKTDQDGRFEIDLEPLDLFAGQGQDDPWLTRYWLITVYADKEGYATGSVITNVATPTISPFLEIVSIDPPLDFLSQKTSEGMNYSELLDLDIKITVRYNNIYPEGSKLALFAGGNWAVSCVGDGGWASPGRKAHLAINGIDMPEWNPFIDKILYLRGWTLPGYIHPSAYYWYPSYETEMEAKSGFGQESEITVSGQLFGYSSDGLITNPCSTSIANPLVPPDWLALGNSGAHVGISLGKSDASVHYRLTPPTLAASGQAWISPADGELDAEIRVGQASGFLLARQNLELSIVAKDIASGAEAPSDDITIQASATTDDGGKLELPLTSKENICELENKASYFVKISSSAIEGEPKIPIELRCVEELHFSARDENISLIQATDLTDYPPFLLAAGKETGVRVYYDVKGEIYQPADKPASFEVKFELLQPGTAKPVVTQLKKVLLTDTGASVHWVDPSNAVNQAGIGTSIPWAETPTSLEGEDSSYIDFVFTPRQVNGKEGDFQIRITFDPEEVYGKKVEASIQGTVLNMKTLRLIIVPVDIYNLDMNFVLEQTSFLHETYPLGLSNLILDLRDIYETKNIPLTCTSLNLWKEIACGVGREYGVSTNANDPVKVIAIVDSATWLNVNKAYLYAGGVSALGTYDNELWDSATNNVVLIRYPENVPNTAAHEIGHAYGLELDEQYKQHPPHGLPVTGLVLRNGQIVDLSSHLGEMNQTSQKILRNGGFGGTSEIYDLMGNAGYHQDPVDNSIQYDSYQQSWVVFKTYNTLLQALKDPANQDVFLVQGVIGVEGLVQLDPVIRTSGIPAEHSTTGDYELQLVDSSGNLLYSTNFGYTTKPGLFNLQLPYTSGIERLRILQDGSLVTELIRSLYAPEITISPIPTIEDEDTYQNIAWSGTDQDNDQLTYHLQYNCNDSEIWVPLIAGLTTTTYPINLTHLPGGSCRIKVIASDGLNSVSSISESFGVFQKGPIVQIAEQPISSTANEGTQLKGWAYDLEMGAIPDERIVWFSDIDGELGYGRVIDVYLSPGDHTLTLRAQDSTGNFSIDQTNVEILENTPIFGMGTELKGYYFLGVLVVFGLFGFGGVFAGVRWMRRRKRTAPQSNAVQDAQGRWWYRDTKTRAWHLWNGQAWQAVIGESPRNPRKNRRRGALFLFSLLIVIVIGVFVVGGISLVAFNYIPGKTITPGAGDPTQILKMGGGGLLVSILGLLMLNNGIKVILTRRTVVEDDYGRRREKRGISAILNGLGQLLFGVLCLIGGMGWLTLVFYQEVLPWLGF